MTLGDEDSFRSASKIWPLVFAAYRVAIDADLWEGTKWSSLRNDGRARMLVAQLTGYAQDATNPRNWSPREIVVEYLKIYADEDSADPSPDPPEWFEAAKFDNLTLSSDSSIVYLNALREPGVQQTWYVDANGSMGGYDGSKMNARNMRLQLALQADWPLTGVKGAGGKASDDPNRIYGRVTEKPRFTFQVNAEEMDYVEYLRSDQSRPVGAALLDKISDAKSQAAFPEKQTEGDELFTDRVNETTGRLPRHADLRNQDVKRVEIHATLNIEPVSLGMRPGLAVSLEAGDSIPVVGVTKTVVFRAEAFGNEGQTTAIIGPPDSAAIYDPPRASRGSAGFNSGINTGSGKKSDPYEIYDSKPSSPGQSSVPTPSDYELSSSGKTMGGVEASKAVAPLNQAQQRIQNANRMAAEARDAGDNAAAERHEKAARKMGVSEENRAFVEAAKNSMPTTSVNGQVVNLEHAFGKSLVGGGFTMPGGGRQVRAGDLGRGGDQVTTSINGKTMDLSNAGGMTDTRAADTHDRKNFRSSLDNNPVGMLGAIASVSRMGGVSGPKARPVGPASKPVAAPATSIQQMMGKAAPRQKSGLDAEALEMDNLQR